MSERGEWRVRSLEDLCARAIVAGMGCHQQQLSSAQTFVLEGLWARAAESDKLCDAAVASLCCPGSQLRSLELGRVPLGVTERGLARGARALPEACSVVRVGWPAHFQTVATKWLTRALIERSDGVPITRLELRAAGFGGLQGGVVPAAWARIFAHEESCGPEQNVIPVGADGIVGGDEESGERNRRQQRQHQTQRQRRYLGLLGRARASAHADWASLEGVTDGEVKSLLRAAGSANLEALCIAGARESEGRFADVLAESAPNLIELRFRDAPHVSDDAAAAMVDAVAASIVSIDLSGTGAAVDTCRRLSLAETLQRVNVDGCRELGDEAFESVCRGCRNLKELSARRCPQLSAARVWLAIATQCLNLERLRCDLNKSSKTSSSSSTPRAPRRRRSASDCLSGSDRDDGDDDESSARRRRLVDEVMASSPLPRGSLERRELEESLLVGKSEIEDGILSDLPPFDAPFRGTKLESLRIALVGVSRVSTAQKWLSALVSVAPLTTLREFEARGSWEFAEDAPPPADRAAVLSLVSGGTVQTLSLALDRPDALLEPTLADCWSIESNEREGSGASSDDDDFPPLGLSPTSLRSWRGMYHPPNARNPMTSTNARLTSLNVSCRGMQSHDVAALFPSNRLSTLRVVGLSSDEARPVVTEDSTIIVRAPSLETLRIEGLRSLAGVRFIFQGCRSLSTVAARRSSLVGFTFEQKGAAPNLYELSALDCRVQDLLDTQLTRFDPGRALPSLRRLAVPRDSHAADFFQAVDVCRDSASLRSLTIDELDSSSSGHPQTTTTTTTNPLSFGAVVLARAAAANAYVGDTPTSFAALAALVAVELVCVRDLAARHVAAIPAACPALRRLRLIACKGLRGPLVANPPAFDASSVGALPTGLVAVATSTPQRPNRLPRPVAPVVSQQQEEDDDGGIQFDFEDDQRRPSSRSIVRFGGDVPDTETPPRTLQQLTTTRAAPTPSPRQTVAGVSRNARKERFDSVLQCHVGCAHGEGPVVELMRALADTRSQEYRRYAKLASLLPRDKKGDKPVCVRLLANGVCSRAYCDSFAHLSVRLKAATEKKLRPLFELVADIDDHRSSVSADATTRANAGIPQSWPPGPFLRVGSPLSSSPSRRGGGGSSNNLLLAGLSDGEGAPSDVQQQQQPDADGLGQDDEHQFTLRCEPLVFGKLEALEVGGCDGLESLKLEAPSLLALAINKCEKVLYLDALMPNLTHLDLSRCQSLRALKLRPGSFQPLKVASLASTNLPESFLHKFVDHCRCLQHLDIYGVELKPSSKSRRSTSRQSRHSDPYRARRKSTAGLDKLKTGRPDLNVVRTRKDHESPENMTRTTLDLKLA